MDNPNIYGLSESDFIDLLSVSEVDAKNELQYIQTHKKPDQVTLIVSSKTEAVRAWRAGASAVQVTSAEEFSEAWEAVSECALGRVLSLLDRNETKNIQQIIDRSSRSDSAYIPNGYKVNLTDDPIETKRSIEKISGSSAGSIPQYDFITADRAEEALLRFLWRPYIPQGEIVAVWAPAGTGKTTLLCGICACISAGSAFPGDDPNKPGRDPKRILYISREEESGELKEKLLASGADLTMCDLLGEERSKGFRLSYLPDLIERSGACMVVVDPWHECIDPDVNINSMNEVDPLLSEVKETARIYNVSIVLVSHPNKGRNEKNANNGAIGSSAFINKCRSGITIERESRDEASPFRLMFHTKINGAPTGRTIRYEIISRDENHVPGMRWAGFSALGKSDLEYADRTRRTLEELQDEQEAIYIPVAQYLQNIAGEEERSIPFSGFTDTMKAQKVDVGKRPAGILKKSLQYIEDQDHRYILQTEKRIKLESGSVIRGFSIRKVKKEDQERLSW